MKKYSIIVVLLGLIGCTSGDGVDSQSVKKIAPYGIYLGMNKAELDKIHPVELRKQNNIMKHYSGGEIKKGKPFYNEGSKGNFISLVLSGPELTDSFLGEKYLFTTVLGASYELIGDVEKDERYVWKMSVQREYHIKGKCVDNIASFKDVFIDKVCSPKRVHKDEVTEFSAYYVEPVEEVNEVGKKVRSGAELRMIIRCKTQYNKVFLQVFGKDYDLFNKYSLK